MGTRSQAFTAKIRNLQELQCRLLQGSVPLPQGHEIANSLKYFSTTLLSVLRDVPGQPLFMMKSAEFDIDRLALFPSLDYKGLFTTLLQVLLTPAPCSLGLQVRPLAHQNTRIIS